MPRKCWTGYLAAVRSVPGAERWLWDSRRCLSPHANQLQSELTPVGFAMFIPPAADVLVPVDGASPHLDVVRVRPHTWPTPRGPP